MKNALKTAQLELAQCEVALEKAREAAIDFARPFLAKIARIDSELRYEEGNVAIKRGQLMAVLDRDDEAAVIDEEIQRLERRLARFRQRLKIAYGWRSREAGALAKLEIAQHEAETALQEARLDLIRATVAEAMSKRSEFLNACEGAWAAIRLGTEFGLSRNDLPDWPIADKLAVDVEFLHQSFGRLLTSGGLITVGRAAA